MRSQVMDPIIARALHQIELGEAEVAILRQEQAIRVLLGTGEPTAEATVLLTQLRELAQPARDLHPSRRARRSHNRPPNIL